MLRALEQIRRMRGGAQSHLMRCDDGNYYVVKFQNNPQHRRVLVNEMLGTRLAGRLGLPTVPVDPHHVALHDFLPDEQLREVENLQDFAGMLVFDKWTCNTNGRQTVFFYEGRGTPGQIEWRYKARMIDQGFCFNAGEWSFPDAPLRGLYARNRVYQGVTGMESFAPWLERLEKQMTERVLDGFMREIPPEWYEDDYDAVSRLAEQLHRRRSRVPELILEAKRSNRRPFLNWI